MKITRLNLISFGKFENFSIDLNENLNIFFGRNEAGKSTVCDFIRVMLYGCPKSRKKEENLREKYMPWGRDIIVGTMYVENDNKYIIERTFGEVKRKDKLNILNSNTGENINIGELSPGEFLLGIGEDAFLKSVYMPQLGAEFTRGDKDDEIIKRLTNLSDSGDEAVSYLAVRANLTSAAEKLVSKNGKSGEIKKLEQQRDSLYKELEQLDELNRELKADTEKKADLTKKLAEAEVQKKETEAKIALAKQQQKYLAYSKAENEIDELNERLKLKQARMSALSAELLQTEEKLKSFENIKKLDKNIGIYITELENRCENEYNQYNRRKSIEEKTATLEKELAAKRSDKKRPANVLMLIIAAAVFSMSIAFSIKVSLLFLILLIPTAVLAAVSFINLKAVNLRKKEIKNIEAEINRLKAELEECHQASGSAAEAELEKIFSQAGVSSKAELISKIEQMNLILASKAPLETELGILNSESKVLSDDISARLQGEKSGQPDKPDMSEILSLTELEQILAVKNNELVRLNGELMETAQRVSLCMSGRRTKESISFEASELEQMLEEYSFKYAAVQKAVEVLDESYAELKKVFAPRLNEEVAKVLNTASNGRYSEVKVTDEYSVSLSSGGIHHSISYFSGGTHELVYVALRLGILNIIFDGAPPLLILDDTFIQLDDARQSSMLEMIKQLKKTQVLYFSCKDEIKQKIKNNIINL